MKRLFHRRTAGRRDGAAVVETALMLPLLIILFMGIIEVGQLIIVKQNLINGSRLGARHACRNSTSTTDDVSATVVDYFSELFPNLDSDELAQAISVQVFDDSGNELESYSLDLVPTGEKIAVQVEFDFSSVQWMGVVNYWDLSLDPIRSYSRRE